MKDNNKNSFEHIPTKVLRAGMTEPNNYGKYYLTILVFLWWFVISPVLIYLIDLFEINFNFNYSILIMTWVGIGSLIGYICNLIYSYESPLYMFDTMFLLSIILMVGTWFFA